MLRDAFICDAIRTPIGRYAGALANVRADDLAALPLKALMARHPRLDWSLLDDVILGCANQGGEDNRNVARMATLLAGLPVSVGGATVNRLCGSGLEAVAVAARSIGSGEGEFYLAGGVESMSRAPFVIPKAQARFDRQTEIHDSTIGWRFVNPVMETIFGVDSLGMTAEHVADEYGISREAQDAMALQSQTRSARAQQNGRLQEEIVAVTTKQGRNIIEITLDEHPRSDTTAETLAKLRPVFREGGSVTAGNSSGINDGAAALIIASERAIKCHGLRPRARIIGIASAGVAPRVMGIGPVPAVSKLLSRLGLTVTDMDVIELNEAFAAQGVAVLRALKIPVDAGHVNPNGGAIALGHPLGMTGARLVLTATRELELRQGRYALCTMCIGVGQGIAAVIQRV